MSKKTSKKKVVISTATKENSKRKISSTVSKARAGEQRAMPAQELIFNKQNYMLMGLGALLIGIGLLLMTGGGMPSPEVWDENIIYGFRRTVLAPFVMLCGLIVEIFAIFKK